jgi:hypothetical protein
LLTFAWQTLENLNFFIFFFHLVWRDSNGESRGFATVNFSDKTETLHAVIRLQGETGLGSNPLDLDIYEKY